MGKLMVELPDSVHGELKRKAAAEHTTLKSIISGLIGEYLSAPAHRQTPMKKTGLCGSWDDDRPAEQILHDIRSRRTWFSRRKS